MPRIIATLLLTLALTFCAASSAQALVGFSIKLGGGLIPDGRRPGGIVQADIGPISPFAEFFKKSGTTFNTGANFLVRLPTPLLSPYAGFGGGISRTTAAGISKSRTLMNLLIGADLKTQGTLSFFGQAKYIYTFGGKTLALRELAFQAGLRFYFGL